MVLSYAGKCSKIELLTIELNEIMTEINNSTPFAFKGKILEGDLRKYKLRDGDVLHYWTRAMANK